LCLPSFCRRQVFFVGDEEDVRDEELYADVAEKKKKFIYLLQLKKKVTKKMKFCSGKICR